MMSESTFYVLTVLFLIAALAFIDAKIAKVPFRNWLTVAASGLGAALLILIRKDKSPLGPPEIEPREFDDEQHEQFREASNEHDNEVEALQERLDNLERDNATIDRSNHELRTELERMR